MLYVCQQTSFFTSNKNAWSVISFSPALSSRRKRRVEVISLQQSPDDDPNKAEKQTSESDTEKISDLDARVLQSLLRDENLDLKSEQNLKKMLEKGVNKRQPKERNKTDESKSDEFSSTFFKAINDNELWNSFVAKADEAVESAKIYIQNRVERDVKLFVGVGLFAWQRALKDVGRALPSAGRSGAGMAKKMRDSLFRLSNNSSFVEYQFKDNFILPPSKYSEGVETSVFEELNTPMDEIKSVTAAIRDILSGKGVSNDRGLKSVAKSRADRQFSAYTRKRNTVLKREKEGIDAKTVRAASSVTDSIWELKREMEVEGNEAGYKAKDVQQRLGGTLESVGLLGRGQNKVLRGIGERIFGKDLTNSPLIAGKSNTNEIELGPTIVLTETDLNEERSRLAASLKVCLEMPGQTWLTENTISNSSKEQSTEDRGHETSVDDGRLPLASEGTPELVLDSSSEAIGKVITMMVLTRNDLEAQSESFENQEEIIAEFFELKKLVDMIGSLAAASAGYDASEALRSELLGSSEGDDSSLLSSLDEIVFIIETQKALAKDQKKAESVYIKERGDNIQRSAEMNEFKIVDVPSVDKQISNKFESEIMTEYDNVSVSSGSFQTVVTKVISSEETDFVSPRANDGWQNSDAADASYQKTQILTDADFEVIGATTIPQSDDIFDNVDDGSVYASAEIVIDDEDDFELNSAAFDDKHFDNSTKEKNNVFVNVALRTVDISLFVIEKTLTVGLPGLFSAYKLVTERTEYVNRKGLGKEGWDDLENICDADKRY